MEGEKPFPFHPLLRKKCQSVVESSKMYFLMQEMNKF